MVRAPQILCVGRRRVPLLGSLYGGLVVLARETARVGRYVGTGRSRAGRLSGIRGAGGGGAAHALLAREQSDKRLRGAHRGRRGRTGAAGRHVVGAVQSRAVGRDGGAGECPAQATHVLP